MEDKSFELTPEELEQGVGGEDEQGGRLTQQEKDRCRNMARTYKNTGVNLQRAIREISLNVRHVEFDREVYQCILKEWSN